MASVVMNGRMAEMSELPAVVTETGPPDPASSPAAVRLPPRPQVS